MRSDVLGAYQKELTCSSSGKGRSSGKKKRVEGLRRLSELSKDKKRARRDEKEGNVAGGWKKDRKEEKVHGEDDK